MSCVQDTPSIALSTLSGVLSAALKVSADAGNVATVHADGLYVGGPAAIIPAGAMLDYGAAAAPSGWLLCDGTAVSRSTFSALFGIIGTAYGSGDGSTTFNVPDYRGRVSVGYAASGGHVDVSTLGASDGQAAANRRPKHRTTQSLTGSTDSQGNHAHNQRALVNGGSVGGPKASTWQEYVGDPAGNTTDTTTSTNGAHTHTVSFGGSIGTNVGNDALDTPSYLVANKIIKT